MGDKKGTTCRVQRWQEESFEKAKVKGSRDGDGWTERARGSERIEPQRPGTAIAEAALLLIHYAIIQWRDTISTKYPGQPAPSCAAA
jgi:hypothetical protein